MIVPPLSALFAWSAFKSEKFFHLLRNNGPLFNSMFINKSDNSLVLLTITKQKYLFTPRPSVRHSDANLI